MQFVNLWAVLGSVVFSCILGTLWFGPIFGKSWMHMMGISKESMEACKTDPKAKAAMRTSYGIMMVSSLVMTYVLASLMQKYAITDYSSAMQFAALIWLGFVGTTMTGMVSWENKPWKLWAITSGYYLVNFVLVSMILVRFQ